jgi:hypothetical protein
MDKHTSLSCQLVSFESKSFIKSIPAVNDYFYNEIDHQREGDTTFTVMTFIITAICISIHKITSLCINATLHDIHRNNKNHDTQYYMITILGSIVDIHF